jgi:hypothetical protein
MKLSLTGNFMARDRDAAAFGRGCVESRSEGS